MAQNRLLKSVNASSRTLDELSVNVASRPRSNRKKKEKILESITKYRDIWKYTDLTRTGRASAIGPELEEFMVESFKHIKEPRKDGGKISKSIFTNNLIS